MFGLPLILTLTSREENVGIEEEMTYTEQISWESFIDQYAFPIIQYCISLFFTIYRQINLFNLTIFLVKYVPMVIYSYKLLRNIYLSTHDMTRRRRLELEDIQLQVEILETKMCVRDAEVCERERAYRASAERLRRVRAQVRHALAATDLLDAAAGPPLPSRYPWDRDSYQTAPTSEQENESINELINEMKCDPKGTLEKCNRISDCGERGQPAPDIQDNTVYSSVSDGDKKECRVKIVKVTNVYKVAYLKHFIKQKKIRRATKQAVLKKKIENIRKLLEEWQNALSMVINYNKGAILDNICQHPLDVASQEAMGDCSKRNFRESSDSDSDMKMGTDPSYYDEYNANWVLNSQRKYPFNFEDIPDTPDDKDYFDLQEYDVNCNMHQCECAGPKSSNVLLLLPEETSSQLALEAKSEAGEDYMQNLIEL